jgi:hypothetical protein
MWNGDYFISLFFSTFVGLISPQSNIYFDILDNSQRELKMNGHNQVFVFAADVNLLWENINTTENNVENLIQANEEISLEVDIDKTKYVNM